MCAASSAKPPAACQGPANFSLETLKGLQVKVKTLHDEVQTGQTTAVYAYDATTNTLMLQRASKGAPKGVWDVVVLKVSALKEVHVVSDRGHGGVPNGRRPSDGGVVIRPVALEGLAAREQASRRAYEAEMARWGVGVTQEGQRLFDALSRTLPCRWEKQSILVLDEVYIDPPYTVEACRAASKDAQSYQRVCRVVRGVRLPWHE
ncbi:hypothetical protein PORY_000671 [Pneumocystis oryctolagi]|uniref:Uncharacterized protein n=1 Tax=Pneumocystis oryctolagi TaxID=42067 RepID=A0ACB7CDC5_9ASCO|nr:hypothetical protein PORY_000671 [Pneumocystis oryctolagi]